MTETEYFSAKLDGLMEFWKAVPDMVRRYDELTPEERMEYFGVDYQIAGDQLRHVIEAEGAGKLTAEQSRRLTHVRQLREKHEPAVLRIRAQG